MRIPFLIQHGELDMVADPRGSIAFYEGAVNADRSLEIWQNRGHHLLREEGWENVLWQTAQWIRDRTCESATISRQPLAGAVTHLTGAR
jgi:acylglycerol lipase